MDKNLQAVAGSQGRWSATANRLKTTYERVRSITFVLSIVGALLAAVASQMNGRIRLTLAISGAVLFAVVSFLTARFLGAAQSLAWVRARAASEALKREAYKYAAQAAPYDDPATRGQLFNMDVEKVEADVDDLINQQVASKPGNTPTDVITPSNYIDRRVKNQIENYYEPRALQYQAAATKLRRIELVLALATTCFTAVVGVANKELIGGLSFDFVALIAVLTTISGAILAYVEASRYDFTVASYRATARRLRAQLLKDPTPAVKAPSAEWSAYVQQCEAILQEENNSWVAKFGKPAPA
jgi:hypothetical protein